MQLPAVMAASKYGIDIEIKAHKKIRSCQQNRYLMAVMQAVVEFYQRTGFKPDNLADWTMRTDVLKEFWKARFGITETHKLSTKEFCEFIDNIQLEMVNQSGVEYESIIPPDYYGESLTKEYEND